MGCLSAGAGSAIGGLGQGLFGFLGSSNAASAQQSNLNKELAYLNALTTMNRVSLTPFTTGGTNAEVVLAGMLGLPSFGIPGSVGPDGQPVYGSPFQANAGMQGTPQWGSLLESPQQFSTNVLGVPLAGAPTPYNLPPATLQQFQASPGYQFQLQQGVNAIQNAAGPTQGVLSGNTLQGLQKYGTGLANQDWYNWLTNYQNQYNTQWAANNQNYWNQVGASEGTQTDIFNRLLQLAGTGQQAAIQSAPNSSITNATANAFNQLGNSQAAGILGQFGALSGGLNSLTNPFANPSNFGVTGGGQLGSFLQNLFNGGGGGAGTGIGSSVFTPGTGSGSGGVSIGSNGQLQLNY